MSRTTSTGHPVIVDERDHEIGSLRKLARDQAAEIARLTAEVARLNAEADETNKLLADAAADWDRRVAAAGNFCAHCRADLPLSEMPAHVAQCPNNPMVAEIARLTAELARVTECYSESHAAVGQLTRDIDAGREIDRQNVAEVNRLTAELAAARAVPADVEAAILGIFDGDGESLDRARTAIARAISDATAARGTVGGLLATAPNLSDDEGQYVANRIGLTYELSTDAGRGRAIKAMRAAEEIIARGPLPKGG